MTVNGTRLRTAAITIILTALIVYVCSVWLESPFYVVAAVGSSAILIFSKPAGAMSQPWAVVISYLVCAVGGGFTCSTTLSMPFAAGLSVWLAIAGMVLTRSFHPPAVIVAMYPAVEGQEMFLHDLGHLLATTVGDTIILVIAAIAIFAIVAPGTYPRARTSEPSDVDE